MSGGEPPPFSPEQQKYLDAHYSNSPPPDYVDVHWLLYNGVLVFLMQSARRRPRESAGNS